VSKNIQIRNVPDDVHEVYKRRAAAAGQSLQEYLLSDLTDKAGSPTMQEWLDRMARIDRTGSTVTLEDIVADIRRHRDA
jgi:CTP synthase (UTP-ammonia lyase)